MPTKRHRKALLKTQLTVLSVYVQHINKRGITNNCNYLINAIVQIFTYTR